MAARILMVQGVSSNAGKSIVTGAICRYLRNRGYRVAPFKPILLCDHRVEENGVITDTRFTFVVRGAGLAPSLEYNPMQILPLEQDWIGRIASPALLRLPDGATHEISLLGRDTPAFSQMPEALRERIKELIREGLARLAERFDIVLVEGAGNPTDLGPDDLTNFFIVQTFPVETLLVTKISAGGAASSLVGTMELLEPEIRRTVIGFILNDFVDCRELVAGMSRRLETRLGIPCRGVLRNRSSVGSWSTQEEELEILAGMVEEDLDLSWLTRSASGRADIDLERVTRGQPFCGGVVVWHAGRMVFTLGKKKRWLHEPEALVIPIYWIGGGQEPRETARECALREGTEELGCPIALRSVSRTFWFDKQCRSLEVEIEDEMQPLLVAEYPGRSEPYKPGLPTGPTTYVVAYEAIPLGDIGQGDVPGLVEVSLDHWDLLKQGVRLGDAIALGIPLRLREALPQDAVLRLARGGPEELLLELWSSGALAAGGDGFPVHLPEEALPEAGRT